MAAQMHLRWCNDASMPGLQVSSLKPSFSGGGKCIPVCLGLEDLCHKPLTQARLQVEAQVEVDQVAAKRAPCYTARYSWANGCSDARALL